MIEYKVQVYDKPNASSRINFIINVMDEFVISDVAYELDKIWFKIKDKIGNEGYILSDCEIELSRDIIDKRESEHGLVGTIRSSLHVGKKVGFEFIIVSIVVLGICYYMDYKIYFLPVIIFLCGIVAIFIDYYKKKHY